MDFERGRTVQGWKPRRLGGGKGDTRASKKNELEDEEIGSIPKEKGKEKEKIIESEM